MKFLKIIAILLSLVILIGTAACSIGQAADTQSQSIITRGDLAVKVNGSGKISYAVEAKPVFGSAGKIEKVNVKKGDLVSQGTVLAKLETGSLELALLQAKAALGQTQKSLTQAEIGVTQAQINLSLAKSAQAQAVASAAAAQFALNKIQAVGDIKDKIQKLEMLIAGAEASRKIANATGDSEERKYIDNYLIDLHGELDDRNAELQELLGKEGNSELAPYELVVYNPLTDSYTVNGQTYNRLVVEDIRMKQQQLEAANLAVEQAKLSIEQATQNIDLANQTLEQTKLLLEQNTKAVEVAQLQLDNATIVAPFDGVVAGIDFKPGEYFTGPGLSAVAPVYFVDPHNLQIAIEVDEIDVAGVQVGQSTVIQLDAFPDTRFNGIVDSISIIPKERALNSGIVVYEVKISFAGTPPAQVKAGMSASVDIITAEKKSVLLVPNKFIKQNSQGQKIVNISVDQKAQEQPVTLGLTDGTQTEVLSGLKEGDFVLP